MKNDDEQSSLMLAVIGIIPVIWFALLVAPYLSSGLMGILDGVPEAMNHPFSIRLCGDDQWQAGTDGIACSASCGLPEKPDEKICLDVSAQILICCFCSRNRISYCVCSDILKLQFLFPPCKSF